MLSIAGAVSGLLSGLFGVGGGFVIVPSLLYAGIGIHRAVATSLMVIFLISVSGVVANIIQGQHVPVRVTSLFVGGCLAGMLAGSALRSRLSGSADLSTPRSPRMSVRASRPAFSMVDSISAARSG